MSVLMRYLQGQSKIWTLLLGGAFLYGSFRPAYLLVLLTLVLWDYSWAILMAKQHGRRRRFCFWVGLLANLLLLMSFKYMPFLTAQINVLLDTNFFWPKWVLPVGLSFHTFQGIAYLTDVYKGRFVPEKGFQYYALYILFYPQLMAGPVERPQNLLPQLHQLGLHKPSHQQFERGLLLMTWGFFKKLAIADLLGRLAEPVFENPQAAVGFPLLLALLCFTVQIYADFSGYTHIARGTAHTLGVRLSQNFLFPYSALSLTDFWQRWHTSLSSWFRIYVYLPLGGNHKGQARRALNVLLTFALSGFWHGANWNFLLWGLWHGAWLILEKHIPLNSVPLFLRRIYVGFVVFYGWIFFRITDFEAIWHCSTHWFRGLRHSTPLFLATLEGVLAYQWAVAMLLTSLLFALESSAFRKRLGYTILKKPFWWIFSLLLLLALFGQLSQTQQNFIYFEF